MQLTRLIGALFTFLIVLNSVPVNAVQLNNGQRLMIYFVMEAPDTADPLIDLLSLNISDAQVTNFRGGTARLYDGDTLLGESILGLNVDPENPGLPGAREVTKPYTGTLDTQHLWRSPTSEFNPPFAVTVDFSSLVDGTIDGRIEFVPDADSFEFTPTTSLLTTGVGFSTGGTTEPPNPIITGINVIPVTLNFAITLTFDPKQQVAAGGVTAGEVLGAAFGPTVGSSGELPASFSITYESTTPANEEYIYGGIAYAQYFSVITRAQVLLNETLLHADLALINEHSSSSDLQWEPGCVGIAPFCSQGTPPPMLDSNGINIGNDFDTIFIQGTGGRTIELKDVDGMSIGLGLTAASPEYLPRIDTGIVGDISVDGFLVEFARRGMWDNTELPADATFFDPSRLNLLVVTLRLEGPNISDIVLIGESTYIPVSLSGVLYLLLSED